MSFKLSFFNQKIVGFFFEGGGGVQGLRVFLGTLRIPIGKIGEP